LTPVPGFDKSGAAAILNNMATKAQPNCAAVNITRGVALATELEVATSLSARTRGLLGRRELPPGSGMLIDPCPSVHTWFMSISIDVIFLDRENRVVGLRRNMKPFRMAGAWRAVKTVELPVGTIAATAATRNPPATIAAAVSRPIPASVRRLTAGNSA
jgi:uncharacterized membrane protein (UPF0127 family)